MIYTDIEIEKELEGADIKNDVYYVGLLPSFIWDRKTKKVVEYASSPNKDNDLIVVDTELIKLEKDLKSYFKEKELTDQDVLVFCINKAYFPTDVEKNRKGKWVRVKIM